MCPTLHQRVQERVTYLLDHAEKDRRFENVLRLLEGVQAAVNNSTTVSQLHSELCEKAELIVESIQQHLLEEEEVLVCYTNLFIYGFFVCTGKTSTLSCISQCFSSLYLV